MMLHRAGGAVHFSASDGCDEASVELRKVQDVHHCPCHDCEDDVLDLGEEIHHDGAKYRRRSPSRRALRQAPRAVACPLSCDLVHPIVVTPAQDTRAAQEQHVEPAIAIAHE